MNSCEQHRAVLADGPIARVEECACGTLHVTVGALTLRLHPEAAASIGDTITAAMRTLALRAAQTPQLLAPHARPS